MSDCKDCPQIKALNIQIVRLNKESVDYEKRISSLESGSAVSEERFVQVFKKLDEILLVLKEREQRIPNLVYGIIGTALGGSIGGVIVWALTSAN